MKLFHVNVNLTSLEPWLAEELQSVLTKLPEFGETTISMESLVVARNIEEARTQMRYQFMRAIAKHQVMDPATMRELAGTLEGNKNAMTVEAIPMSDPRVLFLHCSSPLATAA